MPIGGVFWSPMVAPWSLYKGGSWSLFKTQQNLNMSGNFQKEALRLTKNPLISATSPHWGRGRAGLNSQKKKCFFSGLHDMPDFRSKLNFANTSPIPGWWRGQFSFFLEIALNVQIWKKNHIFTKNIHPLVGDGAQFTKRFSGDSRISPDIHRKLIFTYTN